MQLRKEELKKQGKIDAKVSEVTKDDVINMIGATKDHMLEAAKILGNKGNSEIQDILQPDYPSITDLQTMLRVWNKTIKKLYLFKQVVPRVQN